MKKPLVSIFFILTTAAAIAQPPSSATLQEQYNYLIEESNNYQDYKVIRGNWLNQFRKTLADSLEQSQKEFDASQQKVLEQDKEIKALKAEVSELQEELAEIKKEKEQINFIVFPTDKSNYRLIMWSIIGALTLLLIFFIYRYQSSHSVTLRTKRKLYETEEEFADYKKRSLKKEQKLARQLQDELNKKM